MKKLSLALFTCILLTGAFTSCQNNTAGADDARIEKMDSVEKDLDQSIESLEQKTEELEKAVNDLDTTTTTTNN